MILKFSNSQLCIKNIIVNIRRSRGKDIDAACGQLANKNETVKKEDVFFKKELS